MNDVLDRAGHLSELALDVYRFDGARADIDAHLAACAECRAALSALVAEDEAARIPAPARRGRPAWRTWLGVAGVLAAAALAFIVVRQAGAPPTLADDGLRLKSGAFDFEVFVHDGERSRAVLSGDTVHPGERMGFRVRVRERGFLLVIGQDDQGHIYMCYPSGEVGAVVASPFPETPEPQVLPVAMRFDDILGSERISALLCPVPITVADLGAGGRGVEGCVLHEVTLHKRRREAPPGEDGSPR